MPLFGTSTASLLKFLAQKEITMEYGIEYLRGKLSQKQTRVYLRYKYY